MNKQAGEKLLSAWWFFVLAVVGVGIVSAVVIFSSGSINVNALESGILSEKIADCFVDNYAGENFDIFDKCQLKKELFAKGSNFYFHVSIFNGESLINEIKEGDYSFEQDCKVSTKVVAKNYPKCNTDMRFFDKGGKTWKIVVSAGSNLK